MDEVLAELDRDQFEELWAAAILDHWAGDWHLYPAGLVAAEVYNTALREKVWRGIDVSEKEWRTAVDYLPDDLAEYDKPEQTDEDMEALLRAAYG